MEDTLRYFFSAVFQGIAAIIALGSMFFIYYFDKIENQKKVIRDFLENMIKPVFAKGEINLSEIGIIEFTRQSIENNINNEYNNLYKIKIKEYEQLESKEKIKDQIPSFLKLAITILILSLISLFLVGYNCYMNYFLIFVGIITIIMTIIYLKKLLKLILNILDIKK